MISPLMEILASRAFPVLADAVQAVWDKAMVAWEDLVCKSLPSADKLTLDQLRDDLPQVLIQVGAALRSDRRYAAEALCDVAPVHGTVRFEQGFKLDEIMIEYSILRTCLINEVTAYLGRRLEADEFTALSAVMDVTVRRGVVRFVDHLTSQLKAASEAQSKYLSFLSHDLRGGLNGVFLMIEVIKRELINEPRLADTVDDLDVMRRSLLDTVATMDRFLHAERFRKGKVQVHPTNIRLRNVLAESIAHFSYQAKEKRVNLRLQVPGEYEIYSDRELLTLIFQNLISNALKYTSVNTDVTIDGKCQDGRCTITVADQGPGIASDKMGELFAPFTRGETHGQPGVGLGLTIARQAAQCLGAKLWAESKLGTGATFFVEFSRESGAGSEGKL